MVEDVFQKNGNAMTRLIAIMGMMKKGVRTRNHELAVRTNFRVTTEIAY